VHRSVRRVKHAVRVKRGECEGERDHVGGIFEAAFGAALNENVADIAAGGDLLRIQRRGLPPFP
jgi:hypothetical protein